MFMFLNKFIVKQHLVYCIAEVVSVSFQIPSINILTFYNLEKIVKLWVAWGGCLGVKVHHLFQQRKEEIEYETLLVSLCYNNDTLLIPRLGDKFLMVAMDIREHLSAS